MDVCVSVFDKYLQWPCVSVKKIIRTLTVHNTFKIWMQKCKLFTFTQDLHTIYTTIHTYMHKSSHNQSLTGIRNCIKLNPLLGIKPGIKVDNHDH
jgi:hypothetical protein